GWSTGILLEEFFRTYEDYTNGKKPLQGKKTGYSVFVKALQKEDRDKQKIFWNEYLAGAEPQAELSIKHRKGKHARQPATFSVSMGKELKNRLEEFAALNKITTASMLYTAWGLLVRKYNDCSDVMLGTTVSGRPPKIKGIEEMVGLFINTIPIRINTPRDENISQLLQRVRRELYKREQYETASLVDIKEYACLDRKDELFDTILVMENYPLDTRLMKKNSVLAVESYSVEEMTHYDLTVEFLVFENLHLKLLYDKNVFDTRQLTGLTAHFRFILEAVLENPDRPASSIEIVSEEEKHRLLFEFNDTGTELSGEKTIHEMFRRQVEKSPGAVAIKGRSFADAQVTGITYKRLDEKANQLAHYLVKKGAGPDSVVGLMVERSIEMIIGILGILKAGGAYLPIDPQYPDLRIKGMLQDAKPKQLLVDPGNSKAAASFTGYTDLIDITAKTIYNDDETRCNPRIPVSERNLLYMIYTSGSTGIPKGVMLEHRNLVNLMVHQLEYSHIDFSRVLQFTTISFDVSFQEIFSALLSGGTLFLIDAETRQNIPELFDIVEKNKIKTLFLPASFLKFVFNEGDYLHALPREVSHIISAGEQLVVNRRFQQYLRENNIFLHNHYGPSETHVVTTFTVEPGGDIPHLPCIGKPVLNTAILILDKNLHLQPVGVAGELYISGIQVGRGYLGREDETGQRYIKNPYPLSFADDCGQELLYKTGDLARQLPDGNIECLGRVDFQVKIRGFRVELEEIENHLLNHDKIKEAAVIDREGSGSADMDKYLCAYIVTDEPRTADEHPVLAKELYSYLSALLPEYMVPAYFVTLEKIPVTPNGKVARKELPEPEIQSGTLYTAPRNDVETKLAGIWATVLGVDAANISIDADFFRLGGHSLKATSMAAQIHKAFEVRLAPGQVFQNPTIAALARLINLSRGEAPYTDLEAVEKREYYPLSSNQHTFYMLHQVSGGGVEFNVPLVLPLDGDVDLSKIETAFKALLSRHESLRTSFVLHQERPVQIVHQNVEFTIEYHQADATPDSLPTSPGSTVKEIIKRFVRPFDLSRAPLLRVGVLKVRENEYLLLMDMHHIVTDGASLDILAREFNTLYKGGVLSPLYIQYRDFACRQNKVLGTAETKEHRDYWVRKLAAPIPELNLPTDFPGPREKSQEGDSFGFYLGREVSRGIRRLARETGTTLYMILLTAYNILLHKITGRTDIIIGSPVANRTHALMENTVGLLMDSLMMRNFPTDGKSTAVFLQEVRQSTLEAFEHQEYPFGVLLKDLDYKEMTGRNPISGVALTVLNMFDAATFETFGNKGDDSRPAAHEAYLHQTAKVDLTITALDAPMEPANAVGNEKRKGENISTESAEIEDGGIACVLEYATALFTRKSMERFANRFRQVL
ncbi:MAG: amino acid adenylation domain-containing protein, partial [bacterium]|nr:amino acid adenylation domain-containing protein [bacterium]